MLHKTKNQQGLKTNRKTLRIAQVIIIGLILLAYALFSPKGKSFNFSYEINDITTKSIIAPFDFDVLKTQPELENDRILREQQVKSVFIFDEIVVDTVLNRIDRLGSALVNYKRMLGKYAKLQKQFSETEASTEQDTLRPIMETDSISIDKLRDYLIRFGLIKIKDPTWSTFLNTNPNIIKIVRAARKEIPALYKVGILFKGNQLVNSKSFLLINQGIEALVETKDFYSLNNARAQIVNAMGRQVGTIDETTQSVFADISTVVLQPNIRYAEELTHLRIEEAVKSVPISLGKVFQNEKIIDSNTRVTEEIKRKLNSLENEYIRKGFGQTPAGKFTTVAGRMLFAIILLSFFFSYLNTYRDQIYNDIKLLSLVGVIYIVHFAIAYAFVYQLHWSEYFVPLTIGAMLFTIIFDGRIAFIAMVTLTLMVGSILNNDMQFVVANLFVSSLAIYSVRKLRTRGQILWSMLFVTTGYILTVFIYQMIEFSDWNSVLEDVLFATANGFMSPIVTYGLLVFIERVFKITSNLTLLELLDFNNKLLNHLAMNAPGTFKHSVDVGNLAVASAEAIGANSLLARVGAYYHDVGKAEKPEYFIENQQGGINKHDKLSPQLSAKIVLNHVKAGVQLAKEHKLPDIITDFITTHHGRSRVEYFYKKAVEEAGEDGKINPSDFQYPGPRPHTKETGILMISEAAEAASRSITKITPQRIDLLINELIKSRVSAGELDECPLTFRELNQIKDAMVPIIAGALHKRIEYPGQREKLHIPENETD
jgi:cyclic-di-AMP phosphodiesterase PgpH